MALNPKITAEVSLRVRLADGTWTNVSKETTIDPSEDLLDVPEAAQNALGFAARSALRALEAALTSDDLDDILLDVSRPLPR